jgi:aminopeptidase N
VRRPLFAVLALATACSGSGDSPVVAPAQSSAVSSVVTSSPSSAVTLPRPSTTAQTVVTAPIATTVATSGSSQEPVAVAGAAGVGDPLYPKLGNGGYDMKHVDLDLRWEQEQRTLAATAVIEVTVGDQSLADFNLDFSGFTVDTVKVDNTLAAFSRRDDELEVTPSRALAAASTHTVTVSYHGVPGTTPDTSGRPLGWLVTPTGSYTLAEPDGAHFWFPCNDHPSDKATYTIHVDVAAPLTPIANGSLTATSEIDGRRRATYEVSDPIASYLVLVAVGPFATTERITSSGLPLREVERESRRVRGQFLGVTEQQIAFFEPKFGPFPFSSYGLLLTDSVRGLAMETATISLFSEADMNGGRGDDESFLSHELGHQWFGDAVTLKRWGDIWLNESFATYSEWLWSYRDDPAGLEARAENARASAASDRRVGGTTRNPKPAFLFGRQVYDGGAIVLHALRRELGDDAFFTLLQRWVATYRGKSAGTEDFVSLATTVARRDMGPFLATWLDDIALPPFPGNPPTAS